MPSSRESQSDPRSQAARKTEQRASQSLPGPAFSSHRPRRLRRTAGIRRMVRETQLTVEHLIYPLFVEEGISEARPIDSMPGVSRLSPAIAAEKAAHAHELGIPSVLLFSIPQHKDAGGSESFAADGVVQQAVRSIKERVPEIVVITDVCLCEYSDHGHCGVLNRDREPHPNASLPNDYLLNDETLAVLQQIALSHAGAGAEIVAPSGMIDGMVGAIRSTLDQHGFTECSIMSYAIKYASAFYGPFREAADGAPRFGDRRTHQMDPGNAGEAVREAELDRREGADFLMVKPALAYLDVLYRIKAEIPELPLVAYNVSGEFSMLRAAGDAGYLDAAAAQWEVLTAIRRAGADLIITYAAPEIAEMLLTHG